METHTKEQVRQFYNRVGWQEVSEGYYQNASYEDLRKVSSWYIRSCHLRVNRFLPSAGRFLLDAGSGPIQYPEYLTYSENHQYRICLDISIIALKEARKRIGGRGLFVVADVANLPFSRNVMDGIVSLHTLHHVSVHDQEKAYREFERVLTPGSTAVVVNGWANSTLMVRAIPLIAQIERIKTKLNRENQIEPGSIDNSGKQIPAPTGTFVEKFGPERLKEMMQGMDYQIHTWRSVSVRFLRALVHPLLGGRIFLRILFWLENAFPHFLGKHGQYPMVVLEKRE